MIKSWLDSHIQKVMVNGSCSIWRSVTTGEMQGAVPGPILGNIFINESEEVMKHNHQVCRWN